MDKVFVPLFNYSDYSVLRSLNKPDTIAKNAIENEYKSCGIIDFNTVAGAFKFYEELKKSDIKPIVGCTVSFFDNKCLTIICKNHKGWKDLLVLLGSIDEDLPRIGSVDFSTDWIITTGRVGSYNTKEEIIALTNLGCKDIYLEIVPNEDYNSIRNIARELELKTVACHESYYGKPEDREDHKILLSIDSKKKLKLLPSIQDYNISKFFGEHSYHFPTKEDLSIFTEDEIENTKAIADSIEDFQVADRTELPKFPCDDEKELLRNLCVDGWKYKLVNAGIIKDPQTKKVYGDRVKHELEVINEAGLAGYFLIVADYVNWAKNNNILVGPGRGCLLPHTKILMKKHGSKDIKDIKINDKVITIDGKQNKVNKIFKYKCNEEIIKFKTYCGDSDGLYLTKDHKILCEKIIYNSDKITKHNKSKRRVYQKEPTFSPSWIKADDINIGDWIYFPIPKYKISDISSIDLSKYSDDYCMTHSNNFCFHLDRRFKKFGGNDVRGCKFYNRFIDFDNDFCRFLGLFIGDGYLFSNNFANKIIGISMNSNQVDTLNFLINLCQKNLWEYHIKKYKNRNSIDILIKNPHLSFYLKDLFKEYKFSSKTKYIPEIIFSLPKIKRRCIINGLIESDGCFTKSNIIIATVSKKLAYQTKLLLLSIGEPCNLTIVRRNKKRGTYTWQDIYRLQIPNYYIDKNFNKRVFRCNDNYIICRIDKKEYLDYNGYVYDFEVNKNHNYLTSNGLVHNSVGGSLVANLLNITTIDPIKYGLLWQRFYNTGRNTPERIALPDIDVDFPKFKREKVVNYIVEKYGRDKVAGIITYGRLKGRNALKEVLRCHDVCSFSIINKITSLIPDEAAIADSLQEQGEDSIVRWCLKNDKDLFTEWCRIDENGNLDGPLSAYFAQAIRIENTIRNRGKHASAIVIGNDQLREMCPMTFDQKHGEFIVSIEMDDAEANGIMKLDLLGLAALDKLECVNHLLAGELDKIV